MWFYLAGFVLKPLIGECSFTVFAVCFCFVVLINVSAFLSKQLNMIWLVYCTHDRVDTVLYRVSLCILWMSTICFLPIRFLVDVLLDVLFVLFSLIFIIFYFVYSLFLKILALE